MGDPTMPGLAKYEEIMEFEDHDFAMVRMKVNEVGLLCSLPPP